MPEQLGKDVVKNIKEKLVRVRVRRDTSGEWYSKKEVDAVLDNYSEYFEPKEKHAKAA